MMNTNGNRPIGTPPFREFWRSCGHGFARGIAGFLGGFCLLNVLGNLGHLGFDVNYLWIDMSILPRPLAATLLTAGGLLLTAFALQPVMGTLRRRATIALISFILIITLENSLLVWRLQAAGNIHLGVPLPFSLIVLLALSLVLLTVGHTRPASGTNSGKIAVVSFALCLTGFPLALHLCLGLTDYRRQVDAIVVFGAKAYSDNHPSSALADRVQAACRLYVQGYAPLLVFSGGPNDGGGHEVDSMRLLAITLGVPDSAILLDRRGLSTEATVANTTVLFKERGISRVLAVSHFFHLPRIKMAYRRAGWEVATVPALPQCMSRHTMLYQLGRETAAFWAYYLRPLCRADFA
ncbi:MAG: YdcF family protein [Armatimonadota bacterium]